MVRLVTTLLIIWSGVFGLLRRSMLSSEIIQLFWRHRNNMVNSLFHDLFNYLIQLWEINACVLITLSNLLTLFVWTNIFPFLMEYVSWVSYLVLGLSKYALEFGILIRKLLVDSLFILCCPHHFLEITLVWILSYGGVEDVLLGLLKNLLPLSEYLLELGRYTFDLLKKGALDGACPTCLLFLVWRSES